MNKSIALALLALSCSTGPTAFAESSSKESDTAGPSKDAAGPSSDADDGGLGEVVVTATRREERLQDVPVAVSAVSGSTLSHANVIELRSLNQVVPAFNAVRSAGVIQPVIRGVGSTGLSTGDESNVAVYIDGIYQADPFSTALDLVEVERVEVLRGPQGTVFGRNATGGLINVITPDPSFQPSGRVAVRYGRIVGDANDYDARTYLTGGLSNTAAVDFAGLFRRNDGYVEDLVSGGTAGNERLADLRSKVLFEPADGMKLILSGDYANFYGDTNTNQPVDNNTAGRSIPGVILPTRPYQISTNGAPVLRYKRYNIALRTAFDLGRVSLETSTGYLHTRNLQFSDSDSTNVLLGQNGANSGAQTLMVSNSSIMFYSFGVFLKPISTEFGWSRGGMSLALGAAMIATVIGAPVTGKLIDHFGIKKVMLPAIILFSVSFSAVSLTPASLFTFIAIYWLVGLIAAANTQMPYAKAISSRFNARRGLALGLANIGTGLGATVVPPLAAWLVDTGGWRLGYLGLGALIFVIAFPSIAFLVTEPADVAGTAKQSAGIPGINSRAAFRTASFWQISVSVFLLAVAVSGTIAHLPALLTDGGAGKTTVTAVLATVGISTIIGRLVMGYLLDKFFAPYVASVACLISLVSVVTLVTGTTGLYPFIGAAGLGIGVGAEGNIIGYFVGRYFGLRYFGEICGYLFSAFSAGAAVGPYLLGVCFDLTHSYNVALLASALALVAAAITFSATGPYRFGDMPPLQSKEKPSQSPA